MNQWTVNPFTGETYQPLVSDNVIPQKNSDQLCEHLRSDHSWKEMDALPKHLWDDTVKNYEYDPVAYYNAAVRLREQEHIPLIWHSLDRRQLTLLT